MKTIQRVFSGNLSTKAWDAEILRSLACFFVVLLHASGIGSTSSIFLNSVSRFCVPVFILISGRFCLAENKGIEHYLKKSGHMLVVFLFWSVVYLGFDLWMGEKASSEQDLLVALITGPIHFWYMYAAIALYLLTPILSVFCIHATKIQLQYCLLLTFLSGSVITTVLGTGYFPLLGVILEKMKLGYTVGFLSLYMFGYYYAKYGIEKRFRIPLYVVSAMGLLTTFLLTLYLHQQGSAIQELMLSFYAPNVVLYTLGLYVFISERYKVMPVKGSGRWLISNISACSFGVYLLHPLLLRTIVVIPGLSPLPNVLYVLLVTVLTFLSACLIVFLLKKTPLEKLL